MAIAPPSGRATRVEPGTTPDPVTAVARSLYERYQAPVYRYCLSRLRSREEAEDALQSTFLRAFSALQRGVEPDYEAAWLFKIAHNVCLSRRLAAARRGRVEAPHDLQELQDSLESPRRAAGDELIALDDVLAEMPERLRTAFLLREWQGLSYQEIADRLDVSHSAVETLIFRARRHLADALTEPMGKAVRGARQALEAFGLLKVLKGLLSGGGTAQTATVAAGVAAVALAVSVPQDVPEPAHGSGGGTLAAAVGSGSGAIELTRAASGSVASSARGGRSLGLVGVKSATASVARPPARASSSRSRDAAQRPLDQPAQEAASSRSGGAEGASPARPSDHPTLLPSTPAPTGLPSPPPAPPLPPVPELPGAVPPPLEPPPLDPPPLDPPPIPRPPIPPPLDPPPIPPLP